MARRKSSQPFKSAFAVACLLAVVVVATLFATGKRDGRQDIDVSDLAAGFPELMSNPEDVTGTLCDDGMECTSAVGSSGIVMLEFDNQDEASAAGAALGGGTRLAGWIVVQFRGDTISDDDRAEMMSTIYCVNVAPDPC